MTCLKHLRRNSKIRLLAIVAMLLPALVQFAQALPLGGNADGSGDGWTYAVICTANGVVSQPQALDAQGQSQSKSQNTSNSKSAGTSCPVCTSFSIAHNTVAPEVDRFVASQKPGNKMVPLSRSVSSLNIVKTANFSRAPPSN